MSAIHSAIAALTEDRRAGYLFDTKPAAEAVGCDARKFGDWWYRTRRKLKDLYRVQPGQLAAELAVLIAEAEAERQAEAERPPVRKGA
jgi:hypothetical protein